MSSIAADLPVLPPHVDGPPPPYEILAQPSVEDKQAKLGVGIENETFVDIDPGVFDNELIKLNLYTTVDPDHPEKEAVYQDGNIVTGTYTGTQAALSHLYRRIERSYESYFDVMQIEPTLPRLIKVEQKQSIYRWSAYPTNPDGSPAQYPPHLDIIPKEDEVSANEIFGWLSLKETQFLVAKLVPDTFKGKTVNWLQSVLAEGIEGNPMVGTLRQIEEYNRHHRKSGTDIEGGKNIGLLPDWFSDRRFADQSFTGTNPTTIKVAPKPLLEEFMAAAHRNGDEDWAKLLQLADPSTLFVQDARYLRAAMGAAENETLFNKEPLSEDNWSCAAVVLYQLHPSGRLHPIAIVIDYKGTMEKSVTIFNKRKSPSDPTTGEETDYAWRFAKTCAQVTDWVRHEVIVHLTLSHFVEEALIVATHRTFAMDHPIFKLLQPHWFKTLSLNAAARATLVPQVIKDLVGVKPEYLFQYMRSEFDDYDYVGSYVPNDLKRRGFPNTVEGLADQRYRDYAYAKDVLPMWYCIRRYVKTMLSTRYTTDKAVQDDEDIFRWCQEVQTAGHIKSFPTITTLEQLYDALTMSIHIAAPFHSAVNYLQNFYHAFVIAKPPSLCTPLPTSLEELTKFKEADLVRALPIGRQRQWLLSVQVPWLLSSKVASDRNLVMFAQSQWRTLRDSRDAEGRRIAAASKSFYDELKVLDVAFTKNSNDMNKDSIPYEVMDPDNTAVSILI
ncbi:lipoxygenase [Lasiosphaeria hispida]|uniref:Manganese lipoxygenase n=1 Tax=Lasiosphaeria hispida TaxID=260671 RepID=A0AAJ0MFF9_9PEZI|nr:lipoxygenase [Lasiosphaeria hispida]